MKFLVGKIFILYLLADVAIAVSRHKNARAKYIHGSDIPSGVLESLLRHKIPERSRYHKFAFPAGVFNKPSAGAAVVNSYPTTKDPRPLVVVTIPEVTRGNFGSGVNSEVLRSDVDVRPDGFNYTYKTQNGIYAQASGDIKTVGNTEAIAIQGSYKYVSPDGTPIAVSYVADENGYQPQGDHLPLPPPVPAAILRSLEWNRAHPEA